MNPTELDRTFVNLTDDPAQGRGARRTYIRRAVMKNYHKRRNQKRKASRYEAEVAAGIPENAAEASMMPKYLVNLRLSPQMCALVPKFSLFEQRKFPEPSLMQISNSILRYMCGQASKVAHNLSLVAFIHPSSEQELENGSASASSKLSPLKTCQNLLRAYGSCKSEKLGLSVDQELLWEMIHQHQEWIYAKARRGFSSCDLEMLSWELVGIVTDFDQVSTLGTWELLSAAQAVAVRAFPNGDIALLYTLGAIFRRLQVEGTLDVSQHPQGDWKQWVFCESFVRVAAVYFTLNAVISMEIGLPCNSPLDWDTEGMLLPASKASWSAQSVDDWKRRTSTLSSYKQLKWKDLLASTSLEDCPVEEWRESSDEMGLLVTMAMTLRAQLLREAVQAGSIPSKKLSASCSR
ncbi:uncharacterized protein TRIREDRAFT_111059 [Trichoderma reesei QM6a]|uniref:Predicted protein n=1 Tax=Hypocrea jecorina (strain QM6a) TaxID=431241 RepID=G0RTN1_HYPJQ|nr:uncharacterized protein TRIREDRAFT_111059 [Trichoderma reesei QM6a]EGR45461.1 predicted protein [Trichoderma reesei QM6a]